MSRRAWGIDITIQLMMIFGRQKAAARRLNQLGPGVAWLMSQWDGRRDDVIIGGGEILKSVRLPQRRKGAMETARRRIYNTLPDDSAGHCRRCG